jgi:peptidyl-tRNA hydrolase, PTH1 family
MAVLLAFLGNPGIEYQETRHNAAWLLADALPFPLSWQNKFKADFAQQQINGKSVYLIKPQTFMNLSGASVQAAAHFYKLELSDIIILHDDIELPFGTVSFKLGGGLAGHNGLRSIATFLGGTEFYRFRIGIGRPQHGSVSDYVLSRFSSSERAQLPDLLQRSGRILHDCIEAPGYKAVEYAKILLF